jgi:hypothetical protein
MTPPEKNVAYRVGKPTFQEWGCHRPIFPHHWLKAERLRKILLADAGRGDLVKTIIDRIERSDASRSMHRTPRWQCAEVYPGARKQASTERRKKG